MKTRKKRGVIWQMNTEDFKKLVARCSTFSEILKYFAMCIGRGNYTTLKRRLIEEQIDYSHIDAGLGWGHNKGKRFPTGRITPLVDVMVENSLYSRGNLKRRLLQNGDLKNECSLCGQKGEWVGKPLTMILDHINGKGDDHRRENLRMVCPNCNSQLETTAGKKRRIIRNCISCGCVIYKKSTHCRSCAGFLKERRKVKERPSKEELEELIKNMPMTHIGKLYSVSDSAVKNWCKRYGMSLPKRRGYWSKLRSAKQHRGF